MCTGCPAYPVCNAKHQSISCLQVSKLIENLEASYNMTSQQCNCGNSAVAHFCKDCLKTHDQYCKIPF